MADPITIKAAFAKAATTADGGWRISFDLPITEAENVTNLAKLDQEILTLVVMTEQYVAKRNNTTKRVGN